MKKETFVEMIIEIRELLRNQKKTMTIDDVCYYTGYQKSYIYKLTSKRKIPYCKKGKSLFFEKSRIDEWLTEDKVKTLEEIKSEANNQKPKKI
jgi:excisionase family DNA binding protein